MRITLDIPDEVADSLRESGKEISRAALEALAAEGYRDQRLSEFGCDAYLDSRPGWKSTLFLKEHGAYLHYSEADLAQDLETAQRMRMKRRCPTRWKKVEADENYRICLLIRN